MTTSTPGFHFDLYTLYRDDPTASAIEITVMLGDKILEVFNFKVKSMGSFGYNTPNIVNHGSSGDPDHEYLGNRGSWTPGVYDAITGTFTPCTKLEAGYAWLIPENQTVWYSGVGGFAGDSGYLYGTARSSGTKYLTLAYTVPKDGNVSLGFSELANTQNTSFLGIYYKGTMIYPTPGGTTNESDWLSLDGTVTAGDLNDALDSVRFDVKAGDVIYFSVRTALASPGSAYTLLHPEVYFHREG